VANLVIVAGTREDINDLEKGARRVFTNILFQVDKYDLYGRVALPKSHQADDVPEIYRLAAASKGVFINPALTEPFGLTILEAAASGLPVVATENGGPVDIIANCECGRLVDPLDKTDITNALLAFLTNAKEWEQASRNGIDGVRIHYSWQAHVEVYLAKLSQLEGKYETPFELEPLPVALRYPDRAIYSDLDLNLIGDDDALHELVAVIRENRKKVSFGIVTGRRLDSALAVMKKNRIPRADVLISSLGTRIHYGRDLVEDDAWVEHIDYDWTPRRIVRLLDHLPGLSRQPKREQALHKISYFIDVENAPDQQAIVALLRQHEVSANVVFSFGQFIDVIPSRASKGQALRYVAQRLDIPLEKTLVAGGSGADEDMMRGNTLAIVVANRHHEELSQLDDEQRIYFAEQAYASGILEALQYYDFFNTCKAPDV
jgi:sucrose-phosphate synthase